jgi:DNA-binding CsgD family transcriptional regulator
MMAEAPQGNGAVLSDPENGAVPQVSSLHLEGGEIFVLTIPLCETRYPEGATPAEHEVIDLLLDGKTPQEIAQLRGSSVRTVTTQLAEIYRKAGVGSSRELAAFTTGVDGAWTV